MKPWIEEFEEEELVNFLPQDFGKEELINLLKLFLTKQNLIQGIDKLILFELLSQENLKDFFNKTKIFIEERIIIEYLIGFKNRDKHKKMFLFYLYELYLKKTIEVNPFSSKLIPSYFYTFKKIDENYNLVLDMT